MRLARLAALAVAPLLAHAQDPVFRVEVSQVKVDVEVSENGRTVHGLRAEDFLVKDNGRPQRLLSCTQGDEPLDTILLFDISESMAPEMRRVALSANYAFSELRPGDRVAVLSFNTQTWLEKPFTEDLAPLQQWILEKIAATRFGGGTYILDAIDHAAEYLQNQAETHRRRAILVFTDDEGHGLRSSKAVTRRLWDADAVVGGLIVPGESASLIHTNGPHLSGDDAVDDVAEETGGEVVNANPPGPAFHDMIARLRKRYTLFYAMPEGRPGETRRVSVELSAAAHRRHPQARVLARKGYVLPRKPAG